MPIPSTWSFLTFPAKPAIIESITPIGGVTFPFEALAAAGPVFAMDSIVANKQASTGKFREISGRSMECEAFFVLEAF